MQYGDSMLHVCVGLEVLWVGWVGGGCLKLSDAHDLTFMHLIHLVHIMQWMLQYTFAPKKRETPILRI